MSVIARAGCRTLRAASAPPIPLALHTALLGAACAVTEPRAPRPDPAPVNVPAPSGQRGLPSPPPPSAARTGPRITPDGIGDLRVGEPLPTRVLDADLAGRYRVRWIADAQPFEGFELSQPPVYVHFAGGPMAEDDPIPSDEGEIPSIRDRLAPRAVARARAGAKVVSLLIAAPELRTEGDVGVGSSHRELDAAHGPITLMRLPEVLEAKPTCDARSAALPQISFWLDGCAPGAEPGAVKWIWIRAP